MKTIWLDTVDSTNTEVLRRLPELESGTVIAAREQTAGRGQRGNTWYTEAGQNLTYSIVLKFRPGELSAADAHWLSYLASFSVADFLKGFGVACSVKWPNDVYVGRKKICGMLIENSLSGADVAASIIGIGININQREFPQLANATSLWHCIGKESNLEECLDKVLDSFFSRLPMLFDDEQRKVLFADYSDNLFNKDIKARYHDLLEDFEYQGIIRGVEPDGRLRIHDLDSNKDRCYRFKEVSYIL